MDRRNIISGVSALQGIQKLQARPATDAEIKHAAQFLPGSVTPAAGPLADDEYQLTLPFPPSMNRYWGLRCAKNGARFMVVTKQGIAYQNLVKALVSDRWRRPSIDYRIAMLIEAWAPDERHGEGRDWEWDVDNRVKPLQDALAKAGVIVNDKLIRDVRIVDRGVDPPGRVVVSIRRFKGY